MVTKTGDTISKSKGRGFASLSPERKREIASKGGRQAHLNGTAHKWTTKRRKTPGKGKLDFEAWSEQAKGASMSSNLLSRFARASMEIDASLVAAGEIEDRHLEPTPQIAALFSERIAALEALLPELRQVKEQLKQRSAAL